MLLYNVSQAFLFFLLQKDLENKLIHKEYMCVCVCVCVCVYIYFIYMVDGKARKIAGEPMIPDGGGRTLRHMKTHNPLIKRQFSKIMFLRGL